MHAYPLLSNIVISFTSHLVIETSQEISDVPYADYFTVEVGGNLHQMRSVFCWLMCVTCENFNLWLIPGSLGLEKRLQRLDRRLYIGCLCQCGLR